MNFSKSIRRRSFCLLTDSQTTIDSQWLCLLTYTIIWYVEVELICRQLWMQGSITPPSNHRLVSLDKADFCLITQPWTSHPTLHIYWKISAICWFFISLHQLIYEDLQIWQHLCSTHFNSHYLLIDIAWWMGARRLLWYKKGTSIIEYPSTGVTFRTG